MRRHARWDTAGFELAPVAEAVGPFPRRPFLEEVWAHFSDGELLITENDEGLAPLQLRGDRLEFVGPEHLVDYRSPLGPAGCDLLVEAVMSLAPATGFRFDSLPGEVAGPLADALSAEGIRHTRRSDSRTLVVDLPGDFDAYLALLSRRDRHELRRKRRRFESTVGAPRVDRREHDDGAVAEFIRLHRLAPGEKGRFMSEGMARFFGGLASWPGWRVELLYGADRVVAAAFGYADDDAYYLYNSAYDPRVAGLSPGIVLLLGMMEQCIRSGLRRFDLLKGVERYKTRLGARPRTLYVVEGST
jgi:CelD/BcsL family acetyltransferase involved in cellulose biosynthesis